MPLCSYSLVSSELREERAQLLKALREQELLDETSAADRDNLLVELRASLGFFTGMGGRPEVNHVGKSKLTVGRRALPCSGARPMRRPPGPRSSR